MRKDLQLVASIPFVRQKEIHDGRELPILYPPPEPLYAARYASKGEAKMLASVVGHEGHALVI
jgi:hypothetical protein